MYASLHGRAWVMSAAAFSCALVVPSPRTRVVSSRRGFGAPKARRSVVMASASADTSEADKNSLPALAVFDLDACLWNQEMFQLYHVVDREKPVMGLLTPDGDVGVTGARSGNEVISLHPGALHALQRFHAGEYPGMRCAAASSADTPLAVKIGRSALDLLEVVPGVTVREVLATGFPPDFQGNLQIGRTPPLSSNKSQTHFPFLKNETQVPFDKMMFFDDCNWGDHCAAVSNGCREQTSNLGPVTVRTPKGLQIKDWEQGLEMYKERKR